MTVYLAYRSFDLGPTAKSLQKFEDDTILDWFRRNWSYYAQADREISDERVEELVGCADFMLSVFFCEAGETELPPPENFEDLLEQFQRHLEEECLRSTSPHVLQIMTEEDGEGGAIYFFDDEFLRESGSLAAYLLQEDWRLPSTNGEGQFRPEVDTDRLEPDGEGLGETYMVLLTCESKYPLEDLDCALRFEGVRLPELSRHLLESSPIPLEEWGWELEALPALLLLGHEPSNEMDLAFLNSIQDNPTDKVSWAAWSDWRTEQGMCAPDLDLLNSAFARLSRYPIELRERLPINGDPKVASWGLRRSEKNYRSQMQKDPRSLFHVEEHLAQFCLHMADGDVPYFHRWIFFDDLWASAHPELANALLRYASRWDVLTEGEGQG